MGKEYSDDDGRRIADMSGVESSSLSGLFMPRRPGGDQYGGSGKNTASKSYGEDGLSSEKERRAARPWEAQSEEMSSTERLMYILGTLKAALSIALVYIIVIGIVIALMSLIW